MDLTAAQLESQAPDARRAADLAEARTIQTEMLPVESLRAGPVTVVHAFRPMAAVGGDFLDYFALPDQTLGLYVGDVCGKGLPAALYAALVVGALRGVHKTGQAPSEVLASLNRRLMLRGVPRRYAAIQYAVFDPQNSRLHIASAGMSGPFLLAAGGCRMLELAGLPPGIFADATYDTLAVPLRPGDAVLFCTDGLMDAVGRNGERFGVERVRAVCAARPEATAELLDRLFTAVEQFADGREQRDDMAAALLRYAG